MGKSALTIAMCLLLVGAALLAGCGGGDEDSSAGGGGDVAAEDDAGAGGDEEGGEPTAGDGASSLASTSESKQEYIAKAKRVCKQQQKRMQADSARYFQRAQSKGVQPGQRSFAVQVLAPGLEAEAEALRELGAPEGEAEQVEAMIAAIESGAEEARQEPASYLSGSPSSTTAARPAREYGLPECGVILS